MGEQGRLSRAVEGGEGLPEVLLVLGQPCFSGLMPRLDGFRERAFPQPRSLGRKRRCTKSDLKTAPGGSEPVKGSEHEVVQHSLEDSPVGGEIPDHRRKLLGFTDNRQDAALQSGHFNDFVFVTPGRDPCSARGRGSGGLDEAGLSCDAEGAWFHQRQR